MKTLYILQVLTGAVRRNGLAAVTIFVFRTIRLDGMRGALHLLRSVIKRGRESPAEKGRTGENGACGDLDRTYSLDEGDWSEWVNANTRRDVSLVKLAPSAQLCINVVLSTNDQAPEDATLRTRESLSKLRLPAGTAALKISFRSEARFVHGIPPDLPGELYQGANAWTFHLRAGDALAPDALNKCMSALVNPNLDALTFDMAYRADGRVFPILLPGVNAVLARSLDHTFSRIALRGRAAPPAGSLVSGPREQFLRWLEMTPAQQVKARWSHIFEPILDARLDSVEIGRVLRDIQPPRTACRGRVSVVICTKDKGHLLRQLVRSLLSTPDNLIVEIIIVSNGTTNPSALMTLNDLRKSPKVTILHDNGVFNFSRLSNLGAKAASGEHIIFLNDDIVPVSDNWLAALLGHFEDDESVGAVGPLLLYPDESIQHAGMYLGYKGIAGHTLRSAQLPEQDYLFYASAPRQVSAVTGAALLLPRVSFEELNGFDERLATYLQDVDLCLRLLKSGFINIFEPRAILIHMESTSIKPLIGRPDVNSQRQRELAYFHARWNAESLRDAWHNPAFDVDDERLRSLLRR